MAKRSEDASSPLWEIVELEAFSTPQKTQQSRRQRYVRALKTWLTGQRAAQRHAIEEQKLRKLPEVRLAHLAPPIDWSRPATALGETLDRTFYQQPVVIFITPPYGGHQQIVSQWARDQQVMLAESPSVEALLAADTDWIMAFDGQQRWALPALERCFLRNHAGIQGVRAFLERALGGHLGQGVIGCDSWSYAFLKHIIGLDSVPTLTLQAVEGEQLAEYFIGAGSGHQALTVYSTRTGEPLTVESQQTHKHESDMQYLAVHCRGQLGIARSYWREQLREPIEESGHDDELWLLDALNEAELTNETGDVATLVLHSLLVHGGLCDQALPEVVPFTRSETLNARMVLSRQGVLTHYEGRWQVAPLAYTSVRELLSSRNYLIDPL
ncbi:hypothetical protein RN347_04815 [Halomonas sp. PAMB 3264]|uniref:hypothetical protein n=1 Tax=Halomonas sp. PAMB 3264 TaxID=3075222 RepID=UPI00289A1788|nr:hypothetical protein [Halomonas sp. PAMB 3264]WNL43225.1 hypothetical protein RN347_04815 [Halomonas sp. PAMB 3264]